MRATVQEMKKRQIWLVYVTGLYYLLKWQISLSKVMLLKTGI